MGWKRKEKPISVTAISRAGLVEYVVEFSNGERLHTCESCILDPSWLADWLAERFHAGLWVPDVDWVDHLRGLLERGEAATRR